MTRPSWIKPTFILCAYGVFSFLRPSEPFLTPYLTGPRKNLTQDEVFHGVYPVWTYSYLAFLIPMFIFTDYVKYKPIIVLQGMAFVSVWLLLVFATGVPLMQLMEVLYGLVTSAEVGYYSYIYSVIDTQHYKRATSLIRAATRIGFFIASTLGQLLVSLAGVDYFVLNVISLVSVSIALVISLFLPMPDTSLLFHTRKEPTDEGYTAAAGGTGDVKLFHMQRRKRKTWREVVKELALDTKECYSNLDLLKWSIWWALSTNGYVLVINYAQVLWESIHSSQDNAVYNGAVECTAHILGALTTLSVGFIPVVWSRWGEVYLGGFSLIKFGLLYLMYSTSNIWWSYVGYVGFNVSYFFVITISQYEIAKELRTQRFALVFGLNTFLSLLMTTLITVLVIDDNAPLKLGIQNTFLLFSIYFGGASFIFLLFAIYNCCRPPVHVTQL